MSKLNTGGTTPLGPIGLITFSASGAWAVSEFHTYFDTQVFWLPTLALVMALAAPVAFARGALDFAAGQVRKAIAYMPSTRHGSARWAKLADFAGLRKRRRAPFWGMLDGKPLFLEYEANALTCAPAGSGKTVSVVVPNLLSIDTSVIAPDLKCELAPMTKRARQRMGQRVYCLNPSRTNIDILGEPDAYNPLVILLDGWTKSRADMLADAAAMALQLYPEPARAGENRFFRNGSRNLITFVMIWEVIEKGELATLSGCLRLLRDPSQLREALYASSVCDELGGDLADLANDILAKFDDGADNRQFESFREGAVQALSIFASSGRIADSVSRCTFRFRDLKADPATVFIIGDPTRSQVYAPWMGLVIWCAATELVRCRSKTVVTCLLDEAANYKIDGLPAFLTQHRGFGVRYHIILQELEDWKRLYGPEALETLLSQTEIQQFFSSRSPGTLEMLSRRAGQSTVKTDGYSFQRGQAHPGCSVGETGRALITSDEISRLADCLVFAHGKAPALAQRVGYHEISPWNRPGVVGINPLHGKRLKGRTRLRL
jgi:type IV secretion system protein VirD4